MENLVWTLRSLFHPSEPVNIEASTIISSHRGIPLISNSVCRAWIESEWLGASQIHCHIDVNIICIGGGKRGLLFQLLDGKLGTQNIPFTYVHKFLLLHIIIINMAWKYCWWACWLPTYICCVKCPVERRICWQLVGLDVICRDSPGRGLNGSEILNHLREDRVRYVWWLEVTGVSRERSSPWQLWAF